MEDKTIFDEDSKALKDFLTDIKCLDPIKMYARKFNLFDVFGIAKIEIRHSYFLKWLLDPKENHGLEDAFIRSVISYLVSEETERYGDRVFELLMMDCSDFVVYRETENNIDLFLLSESKSVVITIENKIDSREHSTKGYDSQLDKYLEYIENTYSNIKTKIFVYLTPRDELPSDNDHWQVLTYSTLTKIIEDLLRDSYDCLSPDVRILIQNYIDIVRRDIVEDNELNRLCNDIYKKHRYALDLIYKHSDMGDNPTRRVVNNVLREYSRKDLIDYENLRDTFHTSSMTAFLPMLTERKSSWGNNHVYNYYFTYDEKNEDRCALIFEIGYLGIDENTKKKMDGLVKICKPRRQKETNKYKRVKKYDWIDLTDLDENEKKDRIEKAIEKCLKDEKTWIEKCQEYLMDS